MRKKPFENNAGKVTSIFSFFSPLPAKPEGTIDLHSVSPSVSPSVSISFPDFFPKRLHIFTWFFGMEVNLHVLQIEFEFRYAPLIFGEIKGLGLSKFQRSNSFPDIFSKCLQILTWLLSWTSITMIYRSSLSFITLHRFLARLQALDLVNFTDEIVFRFFFLFFFP